MSYLRRGMCWIAVISLMAAAANRSMAVTTNNVDVLGGFLNGNAELGKAQAALITAQAALVKAFSEAELNRAKAIQTMEQTRTVALDNNLKATTNYYERRKLYDAYHSLVAVRERPTREDLIRYSKENAPERPAEFQVSRGRILWPEMLQREEFLMQRIQLDALFAKRTQENSGLGSELHREVQTLTREMRFDLKDMVEQLSPAEYLAARKFIDAVAYEAQFPPEIPGVAVR